MKWLTELFPRQYLVYFLYFFIVFETWKFLPLIGLESLVLANTQEQANLYGLSALCIYFIVHSD